MAYQGSVAAKAYGNINQSNLNGGWRASVTLSYSPDEIYEDGNSFRLWLEEAAIAAANSSYYVYPYLSPTASLQFNGATVGGNFRNYGGGDGPGWRRADVDPIVIQKGHAAETRRIPVAITLNNTSKNYFIVNPHSGTSGSAANLTGTTTSTAYVDIEVPAKDSYTLTFENGGGIGPATETKWRNEPFLLPIPVKAGYRFLGWANSSSAGVVWEPGDSYEGNSAHMFYAKWEPVISAVHILSLSAVRADENGDPAEDGENARITCQWRVDGAKTGNVSIAAALDTTPGWSGSDSATKSTVESLTGTSSWFVNTGNVLAEGRFTAEVTITCDDKSASMSEVVGIAFLTIDVLAGGRGIAFGKPATQQIFDVGMETNFDHDVRVLGTPLVPVGTLLDFAGATAPTGYLVCDGSAVSRTDYAALFAVIGTTWGAGDGSSTFNLPDFRGRTAIGAGTGTAADATAHALGDMDGSEGVALTPSETATKNHSHTYAKPNANTNSHTLTVSEMPSHKHEIRERNNSGTSTGWAFTTENGKYAESSTRCVSTGGGGGHSHGIGTTGTATTGNPSNANGVAHNNMQPFATVTKIIRAI